MRKMISKAAAMTMSAAMLAGCLPAVSVAADDVLKVSIACNATSQDHMYNYGLNEFKSVLEEISGGQVEVTTYAGTIGTDESELVEKLQLGGVDIVVASPGFMTAIGIPEIDILSLYYMFDDAETWKSTMAGEYGQKLSDLVLEKSNNQFKVLAYWSSGVRSYYGKKEIYKPEDLDGMTVRTQSAQVAKDFWLACGAVPTSVAWGELYQALQQKVVDSAENDYVSMTQKEHHKTENGKYYCETEHLYLTPVLLTTGAFYDKLTDEQRGWLDEAVAKSTELEQNITFELADDAKQLLLDDGAVVVEHDDMDIDAFKEIAIKIQDDFAEQYGMQEYLEIVRNQ